MEAKKGMILSETIFTRDDATLAPKGTILTEIKANRLIDLKEQLKESYLWVEDIA